MPMTPMEVSASLTSSSLKGLMMASIFFICDPPGGFGQATAMPGNATSEASRNQGLWDEPGPAVGRACPTNRQARRECSRFGREDGVRLGAPLRDAVLAHLRVESRRPPAPPSGGRLRVSRA